MPKGSLIVKYKYEYNGDFHILNVVHRKRGKIVVSQMSQIPTPKLKYNPRLPISVKKKKDLTDRCEYLTIPYEYHSYHNNLPSSKCLC